jgi:putative transcriptional regulator
MVGSSKHSLRSEFSLSGQLLVAMPTIGDSRFDRSIIYICTHSDEGAMGLVINRPADEIAFIDLLRQLKIMPEEGQFNLPEKVREIQVVHGGPVETSRGFVLHSVNPDPSSGSVEIDSEIGLSANLDILHAIAQGKGPDRVVFALGYAGWSAGQLEHEIQQNGWLLCPVSNDILFDDAFETKYERALSMIGVDLAMLSADVGRA